MPLRIYSESDLKDAIFYFYNISSICTFSLFLDYFDDRMVSMSF